MDKNNEFNRSNTVILSHITWIVLTKETVTSKLAKLVKNREKTSCEKFQSFFYFTRSNTEPFPKNICLVLGRIFIQRSFQNCNRNFNLPAEETQEEL